MKSILLPVIAIWGFVGCQSADGVSGGAANAGDTSTNGSAAVAGARDDSDSAGAGGDSGVAEASGAAGTTESAGTSGSPDMSGSGTSGSTGTSGAANAGAGGASGNGGSGGGGLVLQTGIAITVGGLPNGVVATAALVGPNGFSSSVELPATVASLSPGTYTLTPAIKRVPGTRVDSVFDPSVASQTVTVQDGALSDLAVTYAKRPGTGALWMATQITDEMYRFDDAALQTAASASALQSYNAAPGLSAKSPVTPTYGSIDALAFSDTGDAWVGTCSSSDTFTGFVPQAVAKFSPARQGVTDALPDVLLTLPSTSLDYACVRSLAFDAPGNLWVGTAKGVLMRFAKAALATTSTPTPDITIAGLGPLTSIRFDSVGNLFVSTSASQLEQSKIKRLSRAQLTASEAQSVPASTITLPNGYDASGFSFDANGNLWVPLANQGNVPHGQLVRYNANLLKLSFSTAPNITIDTNSNLYSAVFDNTGSVWLVAVSTNGTSLYVLFPEQLTQSTSSTLAFYKGFVGAPWMMTTLTLNPPQ